MVDFKRLRKSKPQGSAANPREIFNGLPKPPGINDLYASQAEVLEAWFRRRDDQDIVIKLHTGGGKTLVALLIAQSVMNETGEPVLYLTPTNQLVTQVLEQSRAYGIPTVRYRKGVPLPSEFQDARSVLVGAYATLFNGRSKFGVRGSSSGYVDVGAIVLDDAHVAISSVRDAFTLTVKAADHPDVYRELADRFRPAFKDVGRLGIFNDIVAGREFGVIEVPSRAWNSKNAEIQQYLSTRADGIDPFVWPFLRDSFDVSHCLFSRNAVTVTPMFPLVDLLPTFSRCKRRVYMSATIADDSEIIRAFGASKKAVETPITSQSLAGVGERLILVPAFMSLDDTPILPLVHRAVSKLAQKQRGVVILSPSGAAAGKWSSVAEYPETTDHVSDSIAAMRAGEGFGPMVLANRYDGIDLTGDACRLLVMDDLPQGSTDYDLFRTSVMAGVSVNSFLAQRIEQGMGRGTRGGADYCVVILVGSKLVGWIGRRKNLDFLTASTRVQLKMGQEVSEAVSSRKEFFETILKCINRDSDWVAYHASELAAAAQISPPGKFAIKVATAERRAFKYQRLGQLEKALAQLDGIRNEADLATDGRAWIDATAARVAFQMGDHEAGEKLQLAAFAQNSNHTPPRRRPSYSPRPTPSEQAKAVVQRLLEFEQRAAMVADFDEAMSDLTPEASSSRYERALEALGSFLGFEAERPEKIYGVGPDVLWRTRGLLDFVIEAKSRKKPENPLYKNDHAQLLQAEHWFKQTYPSRRVARVSALPQAVAEAKATAAGTFALRLDDATRIVTGLRGVFGELVQATGSRQELTALCESALRKSGLTPKRLRDDFMVPFGGAK